MHTVREIIQKTEEYNQPLSIAFIDYEKAHAYIKLGATTIKGPFKQAEMHLNRWRLCR